MSKWVVGWVSAECGLLDEVISPSFSRNVNRAEVTAQSRVVIAG